MKKISLGILIGIVILAVSGVATAMLLPIPEEAKEKSKAEISPVIEEVELDGEKHLALTPPGLEKIVFIHYKKGFAKPPAGGKPSPKCYAFLGRGVKWTTLPVNYVIDPDNQDGLSQTFVESAISAGAEEWDVHTSAEIFGSYTIDSNSSWDSQAPDGRNELLFGEYPEEGVIAITIVWGYFSGVPSTRRIVEFDVLFDTDYTWGNAAIDPTVMDLQNIATHEIGHGAGLADLYDTVCSEETMFGYSVDGEMKKRDLNAGDIMGIQALYGK